MNDLQKIVVRKAFSDSQIDRDGICPGVYPVDFTVRFSGNVDVKEDYMRDATVQIPWLEVTSTYREVFKGAISSLIEQVDNGTPVTREDLVSMLNSGACATKVLLDCICDCIQSGKSAVGSIADTVKEVSEGVKSLQEDLSGRMPQQTVKGRVQLNVRSEIVGMTPTEVAAVFNPSVDSVVEKV